MVSAAIADGEIKSCEEECPACLTGIESFGIPQIQEVLLVGDDGEWKLFSLQPVMPLLQSQLGWLDEPLLESLLDVLRHCLVLQDGQRIDSTLGECSSRQQVDCTVPGPSVGANMLLPAC